MADRINFSEKINDSVQVGDELYYSTITPGFCSIDPLTNTTKTLCGTAGGTWTDPVAGTPNLVGTINVIGEDYVEVANIGSATANDFFMFQKSVEENISSLKGYYAESTFTNNSISKQELFAVGSEITMSSK